ncbi:MAG: saccharopine dehydrogenase NADP-binding domain-containing protein [Pseudomonadota bacterium]
MKHVLIIGGYGNFGSFIARRLASNADIKLIIAGRSLEKAQHFVSGLEAVNKAEAAALDINSDFVAALTRLKPDIVIHTSGPFQGQDYHVARACIDQGCHYIDLADGREFVAEIDEIDPLARANNVLVISGASSVPGLTAALVDHYQTDFKQLEYLDYGITTAQQTNRGLATTAAILGYTGKPFETLINGRMTRVYGWQDMHRRRYEHLGKRLLGNCNIPDLTLFPKRYPGLKTVRFYAGLEIPFIHVSLWLLSWLVRAGVIRHLEKAAPLLLTLSFLFDCFGSADSGFHMELTGTGHDGSIQTRGFELTARAGDGPYIPCMPAIILAGKLARGDLTTTGAYPCMGFISLEDYLHALDGLDISISRY